MANRNHILFLVLSFAALIVWQTWILKAPKRKAPAKKPAAVAQADNSASAAPAVKKDGAVSALKNGAAQNGAARNETAKTAAAETKTAPAKNPEGPAFEHKTIVLGSGDPSTGYLLRIGLDSKGASVSDIEFNDPRYRELKDTKVPLKLIGSDFDQRLLKLLKDRDEAQAAREVAAEQVSAVKSKADAGDLSAKLELEDLQRTLAKADENFRRAARNVSFALSTFNTDVPAIDDRLAGDHKFLSDRNWSVAEVTADPLHPEVNRSAVFRFPSPAGDLIVEKHYWLDAVKGAGADGGASRRAREVRDTSTDGYLLHLDIQFKNAGKSRLEASYILQGPVGLPLENSDNARKFRDIKMGFLSPSGVVTSQYKTASALIADEDKNKVEEWKAPLKYIGVDVQYFAALVVPVDDQLKRQTIERSMAMTLSRPADKQHTDLSVELESKKIELAPGETVTERFELFAGPKRKALLEPLQAEGILDSSWMAPAFVSNAMIGILQFFHRLGLPYGLAIICLTIVVRACMFPLSLRQTMQAQRMKNMQPHLQELKKKYAKDKEKFAMEQMRLMREHKVNPLAGCMPLFLQLPILGGLWSALNNAVDLRLAHFLYFDNLAAPDALFRFPFPLPILSSFLGSTFNLLPVITVCLFVVQQKMFMPPPTDEQQAMQYKMMNVMTIVMGVMFYRVPAGLCVYLISSSLWGLGERKLLLWWHPSTDATRTLPSAAPAEPGDSNGGEGRPRKPRGPSEPSPNGLRGSANSLWRRLLNAADRAGAEATSGSKGSISRRNRPGGKRNDKRPK